jgi:hypothetical protein
MNSRHSFTLDWGGGMDITLFTAHRIGVLWTAWLKKSKVVGSTGSPVLDSTQWFPNPPEESDRANLVVLRACSLNSQYTWQPTPAVVTQILEVKLLSTSGLVLCFTVILGWGYLLPDKRGVDTNYEALHCWSSLLFKHLSGQCQNLLLSTSPSHDRLPLRPWRKVSQDALTKFILSF